MDINANTWLISNSSLYFVDRLLQGNFPVNAYNIFDLSNLTESLLLADRILTLPGRGTRMETYKQINEEFSEDKGEFIEEIDVKDGKIENIVGLVRSGNVVNEILDKNRLVHIFCDIFPIKEKRMTKYYDDTKDLHYKHKKLILDAVSWAPEWARRSWQSTWEYMDEWFKADIHQEGNRFERLRYSQNSAELFGEKFFNNFQFQDLITDTYLRTLLYLDIAAEYQLNYFPDSIRVPLVEYIDTAMLDQVKKFAQRLIIKYEKSKDHQLSDIDALIYERFNINIPPIFGAVIRSMANSGRSKNQFLHSVRKLRDKKEYKRFREFLQLEDRATRFEQEQDIKKLYKMKNEINKLEEDVNPLTVKRMNIVEKIRPIVSVAATAAGFSIDNMAGALTSSAAIALQYSPGLFRYFKGNRLELLKNIRKEVNQIPVYNNKLKAVFGSKLYPEEIDLLNNLRASHKDYLMNNRKSLRMT